MIFYKISRFFLNPIFFCILMFSFLIPLNLHAENTPTFIVFSLNEAMSVFRVDSDGNSKVLKRMSVHVGDKVEGVDPIGNISWDPSYDADSLRRNSIKLLQITMEEKEVSEELLKYKDGRADFLVAISGYSAPVQEPEKYSLDGRNEAEKVYLEEYIKLLVALGFNRENLKFKMVSDTDLTKELEVVVQPSKEDELACRLGHCTALLTWPDSQGLPIGTELLGGSFEWGPRASEYPVMQGKIKGKGKNKRGEYAFRALGQAVGEEKQNMIDFFKGG